MATLFRVTHQRLTKGSLHLDKLNRTQGNFTGYAQRAKFPIYVPYTNPSDPSVAGYLDLPPTDEVLLAQSGKGNLRRLATDGRISITAFNSSLTATPTTTNAVFGSGNLTITGTNFTSLSPDVTYVILTTPGGVVQTIRQSSFLSPSQTNLQSLLNELKLDFNAHRTQGVHAVNDSTNTVTSPDATDEASAITLANELKTDYNAHRTQATVHSVNDSVNVVAASNASDATTLNTLLNELKTDYNAHLSQSTVHPVNDTAGVISTPNATNTATAIALANSLKAAYNLHRVRKIHATDDSTNAVSSSNASDLATSITLVNELKTDYNAHRTQSSVHASNDTSNVVSLADATNFVSAVALAEDIKSKFNLHLSQSGVHSVSDTANVTAATSSQGSLSPTQIVVASAFISGTPTTGWKVQVRSNSKTSSTFTMALY
jgi:hypothetical protein